MLSTLIPLFDKDMRVSAYSIFAQKENYLLFPSYLGTGRNDGAGNITGMEVINSVGMDTLAPDADIFVPVNSIAIFAAIDEQCQVSPNRIALLFDNTITTDALYYGRLKELKDQGFKLAIRKLQVSEYESYKEILSLMDYIYLDCKKVDVTKAKIYFNQVHPNIRIVVGNVESMDTFESLKDDSAFSMFEGEFYRIPVTKGEKGVSPLKTTYLELLNVVNDVDFELTKAADVIGRDTALVVELLKMVNRMTVNAGITSIRHATAMLGQKELKRWINTAVTKQLCADKPSEVMRVSLLRAKFAELLAKDFEQEMNAQELFLMGLFSVLDLVLDMPMEEALAKLKVSKQINAALVEDSGEFAQVYDFIIAYEKADWQEVSRLMLLGRIDMARISDAYVEAVRWYRELVSA